MRKVENDMKEDALSLTNVKREVETLRKYFGKRPKLCNMNTDFVSTLFC